MSPLDQLVRQVLDDRALQAELAALDDTDAFVTRVLSLAAARGLPVAAEQIRARMRDGFRGWLERWVS